MARWGDSLGAGALVAGAAGATLTSMAASICCIGPAGIAILGVNGAILAAGLKPYRVYFLSASLLLLGLAFWVARGRGRRGSCGRGSARARRVVLWASGALWVTAVLIQFAADRYWL